MGVARATAMNQEVAYLEVGYHRRYITTGSLPTCGDIRSTESLGGTSASTGQYYRRAVQATHPVEDIQAPSDEGVRGWNSKRIKQRNR